jgi:DNA invertase Pin-like site-specific DNA recombinase
MDGPRFVSYVRVSTKGQEVSGLGLEAQQAAIRRHLEAAGGVLLAEYREAESGTRADRPALQQALDHCRQTGATLLIAKLDRLARNVHFISGLMESKVRFVACDMPTVEPFMLHVQAAFGEEEARRISRRTREALAARLARGLPLGEKTHRESWTPRKAIARWRNAQKGTQMNREMQQTFDRAIVRRAVELREARHSLREIAEKLNSEGFRTIERNPWNKSNLRKVLVRNGVSTSDNPKAERDREKAQPVDSLLKELREHGLKLSSIADYLNEQGVTTPTGKAWSKGTVRLHLKGIGVSTSDRSAHAYRTFMLNHEERQRIMANYLKLSGRTSA